MEAVAAMLQELGGYGMAGVFFYLYRERGKEVDRYRVNHEKVLGELPVLTIALNELSDKVEVLTNAVARRNQRSAGPGA